MYSVKIRFQYYEDSPEMTMNYGDYESKEEAEKIAEQIRQFEFINPLWELCDMVDCISEEVSRIMGVDVEYHSIDNIPFKREMFCNKDELPPHDTWYLGYVSLKEDFIDKVNKKIDEVWDDEKWEYDSEALNKYIEELMKEERERR